MKNKVLVLLVSLIIMKNGIAQEVMFQANRSVLYSVNYQNPNSTDFNAQRIIRIISEANGIPLYSVSIDVKYDEILKIMKSGNQLRLSGEIRAAEITGDCYYKDFPVSNMLYPDEINFTVNLIAGGHHQKRNVWQKKFTEEFKRNGSQIFNYNYTDTTQQRFSLEISNLELVYSFKTYTEFTEYTDLINSYYSDLKILEKIDRHVAQINVNQLDMLRNQLRDVNSMQADIRAIFNKDYSRKLDLGRNDPLRFADYLRNIDSKVNNAEKDLEHQIRMLPAIYFDQGYKFAQIGNQDAAMQWFKLSLQENPDFAPSIIETARIYYQRNQIADAMERVLYVKERLRPDPAAVANNEQLAENLVDALVNDVVKLNTARKYNDALTKLADIKSFTKRMQLNIYDQKAGNATADASVGLFEQMLDNAYQMLNAKQFSAAEKQISETSALGKNYVQYINYEPAINEFYQQLYDAYANAADMASYASRWDEALALVKNARRICQAFSHITCTTLLDRIELDARTGMYKDYLTQSERALNNQQTDDASYFLQKATDFRNTWRLAEINLEKTLEKRIKQAQYNNFVNNGRNLISANPGEALSYFKRAGDLAYAYDITADRNIQSYINSAATNKFNATLARGYELVNQNNLSQARNIFTEARSIADTYKLNDNEEVRGKLDDLRMKIFSRECQNRYNQYDNISKEGEMLIKKLTFIEAERKLKEALAFANQYAECQINTQAVAQRLEQIYPAARYEEYLIEVNALIMGRSYPRALEVYAQLQAYHAEFNLRSLNINCLSLENFALTKNNDFIYYLAQKYIIEKNTEKGLFYLDELRKRKFSASGTRELQESVARQLVLSDYQKNNAIEVKILIKQYTLGDKWYKYFEKTYKKEWKRMRK